MEIRIQLHLVHVGNKLVVKGTEKTLQLNQISGTFVSENAKNWRYVQKWQIWGNRVDEIDRFDEICKYEEILSIVKIYRWKLHQTC